MKHLFKIFAGLGLAVSLLSSCAESFYVAERPVAPRYSTPRPPFRGAVWIPGEWVYRGGRYTYLTGYWAKPRVNHVYVEGYWDSTPRGYIWHRGYWR
jgi:hypothetical protein